MSARYPTPKRVRRLEEAEWLVDRPVVPVSLIQKYGLAAGRDEASKVSVAEFAEMLLVGERKGPGRPAQLSVRTLLIGLLLGWGREGPAFLHCCLAELLRLPKRDRYRLGVTARTGPRLPAGGRARHDATYRQFTDLFGDLAAAIDPTPVPSRRLGSWGSYDEKFNAAQLDDDEATRKRSLRSIFSMAVGLASVPDEYASGLIHLSVDWTDHDTWARHETGGGTNTADPTAHPGVRRARDVGNRDRVFFYGFELTSLVMSPAEGERRVPMLALAVDLLRAAPKRNGNQQLALDMLDLLGEFGVTVGDVLADSAYPKVPGWSQTLREKGFGLVVDLHSNDKGPTGTYRGMRMIEGEGYCECLDPSFNRIDRLPTSATQVQIVAKTQLTNEREKFRCGVLGQGRNNGDVRVMCPARLGKIRCPLVPDSLLLGPAAPTVHPPAGGFGSICTQQTVTLPSSERGKSAQNHPFATSAWHRSMRRRTQVERGYSTSKSKAGTDATRGAICLMGATKTLLMITVAYASQNIRMLRQSYDRRARKAANTPPKRSHQRPTALAIIKMIVRAAAPWTIPGRSPPS